MVDEFILDAITNLRRIIVRKESNVFFGGDPCKFEFTCNNCGFSEVCRVAYSEDVEKLAAKKLHGILQSSRIHN